MHKINKAIIPLAGLATRIYPMNKIMPKAFLPIIDNDGRIKPLILKLLEELDEAEIEEIFLIIGKNDKEKYDQLFQKAENQIYIKLTEFDKQYEQKIEKLSGKIKYITQKEPLGFADAVYQAKPYLRREPCILILGDTIYKSNENKNTVEQLLDCYDKYEETIIALQELKEADLKYYGTINGKIINKNLIQLDTIVEKPSVEYAKKHLLLDGKFYGNFGEFILTSQVFDEIEVIMNTKLEKGKEYQLMDAFENIIKKYSAKGFIINGKSFDAGNIEAYKKIMREF